MGKVVGGGLKGTTRREIKEKSFLSPERMWNARGGKGGGLVRGVLGGRRGNGRKEVEGEKDRIWDKSSRAWSSQRESIGGGKKSLGEGERNIEESERREK